MTVIKRNSVLILKEGNLKVGKIKELKLKNFKEETNSLISLIFMFCILDFFLLLSCIEKE